jgi:hypothetical protein
MSRWERHNQRCSAFSTWHRTNLPDDCAAIDSDLVEVCNECYTPLALFELARDVRQSYKPSTATRKLGEMAGVPVFVVLYSVGESGEFKGVRIQRVAPDRHPKDGSFDCISPERLAGLITKIHNRKCTGCSR